MPGAPSDVDALAAGAVDWQEVVGGLMASEEWGQLLAGLGTAAGGPSVAALLRRAAAQLLAGPVSSSSGSSAEGGGSLRLAQAVQQVAWEKLHTGDWHMVAVVWRDAYVAACILAAAAGLPANSTSSGVQEGHAEAAEAALQGASSGWAAAAAAAGGAVGADQARQQEAAPQQQEAAALGSALWHLDMAAIMGGPLLRGLVDALIDMLQRRWQLLHAATGAEPAAAALGEQQQQGLAQARGQGEQPGEEGAVQERAPKRPKTEAAAAATGAAVGAGEQGDGSSGSVALRAAAAGAATVGPEAAAATAAADAAHLPPWSLGPRGSPVATAALPSLEAFWRDYMSVETPVVISGAMDDWPALQRWADPAYLIRVAGPRTVPVEVGEHYLAEQWGQQLMTLQQFVQRHLLPGSGTSGAGGGSSTAAKECGAVVGAGGSDGGSREQPQHDEQQLVSPSGGGATQQAQQDVGEPRCGSAQPSQPGQQQAQQQQQQLHQQQQQRAYLAQHPLFDQIPALAADIREPLYCCLGEGEVQSINAWFGPAGTVTPLHTDPHPNLLCQAVGRKYVRLYPPSATPAMYPHEEGMHSNSGQVEVDDPDLKRFPLYAEAPFQDCVLEAGQMLFIPAGWWHYVKSTTVSFSVSYWWR